MTQSTQQERRREMDRVLDQVREAQIEQGESIAILTERMSNLVKDEEDTHVKLDHRMALMNSDIKGIGKELIKLNTQLATIPLGEHIEEHAFLRVLIDQAKAETKKKQAVSLFMTQEKIKLAKATAIGAFLICMGVGWFLVKYWFTNETGIDLPE